MSALGDTYFHYPANSKTELDKLTREIRLRRPSPRADAVPAASFPTEPIEMEYLSPGWTEAVYKGGTSISAEPLLNTADVNKLVSGKSLRGYKRKGNMPDCASAANPMQIMLPPTNGGSGGGGQSLNLNMLVQNVATQLTPSLTQASVSYTHLTLPRRG